MEQRGIGIMRKWSMILIWGFTEVAGMFGMMIMAGYDLAYILELVEVLLA